MSYLLDTNVISEWARPRPDPQVVAWLASIDEDQVFLSVISLAEIRLGVDLLSPSARKERLAAWLIDDLPARFEGRVIPVDAAIADTWGVLMARARQEGNALSAMDAFLAATALTHGLTLATRNVCDFASLGVALFNPWQEVG